MIIRGRRLFQIFRSKGSIIRGRRLIEGRLLFEEIRYTRYYAELQSQLFLTFCMLSLCTLSVPYIMRTKRIEGCEETR